MNIQHQTDQDRFVTSVEGGEAELAYMPREGKVLDFQHTYVPQEARGKGVGEALVQEAFDYARREGFRVVPSCPFVRAWLNDHPEAGELVEK